MAATAGEGVGAAVGDGAAVGVDVAPVEDAGVCGAAVGVDVVTAEGAGVCGAAALVALSLVGGVGVSVESFGAQALVRSMVIPMRAAARTRVIFLTMTFVINLSLLFKFQ